MKKRFHLIGLGCPKNQVDSEVVWAQLASRGWIAVDDPAEAELIVVNTCAFLKEAVEESLDAVVQAASFKTKGRCKDLVVAGCLPGRYGEQLLDELQEVDLFVSPQKVGDLADLLEAKKKNRAIIQGIPGSSFLMNSETPRANSLSAGAAYLKVAEGCSRKCSFCVIPSIRGPQHSRSIDDLLREAENLVRWGANELILVAQDLAAWGNDLPGQPALDELVDELAQVPGLWWLRLMYLFPTKVPEKLLDVIERRETVLPYLDIPLQHVDPVVLKRMHRGGDPQTIMNFIVRIRKQVPGAVLRTSLMTGFPGETQEAFESLERLVKEARFERLGVFAFSPEEGTEAAKMDDQLPRELAAQRQKQLMDIQESIAEDYHRSLVGTTMEVLVEGMGGEGEMTARAWNQAPEVDGETFLTGEAIIGEVVRARITDGDAYDLQGQIIE